MTDKTFEEKTEEMLDELFKKDPELMTRLSDYIATHVY